MGKVTSDPESESESESESEPTRSPESESESESEQHHHDSAPLVPRYRLDPFSRLVDILKKVCTVELKPIVKV